jgi:hypothetical protein
MKSVLIDASSAILLFKSGWLDATLERYRLQTGRAAARELTIPGYPGAARFRELAAARRIEVLPVAAAAADSGDAALNSMGPGERECILHFQSGSGHFILMDDGRGAAYCRDHGIPYTNALLMPRILALADPGIGAQALREATARIYGLGRYAPWVLDYARQCDDAILAPFRP